MKRLERLGTVLMIVVLIIIIYNTVKNQNIEREISGIELSELISQEKNDISYKKNRIHMILNYTGLPGENLLIKKIISKETGLRLGNSPNMDETTRRALIVFQKIKKIPATGKIDRNTKIELCRSLHILNEE